MRKMKAYQGVVYHLSNRPVGTGGMGAIVCARTKAKAREILCARHGATTRNEFESFWSDSRGVVALHLIASGRESMWVGPNRGNDPEQWEEFTP